MILIISKYIYYTIYKHLFQCSLELNLLKWTFVSKSLKTNVYWNELVWNMKIQSRIIVYVTVVSTGRGHTARTGVTRLLIVMLPEKRSAYRSSYWIHDNITSQFCWTYSILYDCFPRLGIFSRSWFGSFSFIFTVSLLCRRHSIMVSTK